MRIDNDHSRMVRDLTETQEALFAAQRENVALLKALRDMYDTAMKVDDVAWMAAIDEAGTRTPLDFARDHLEGSTAWRTATMRDKK